MGVIRSNVGIGSAGLLVCEDDDTLLVGWLISSGG
jgi:hypothetical protein